MKVGEKMAKYLKPMIEVVEFTNEEVVMNLVASSNELVRPVWPPPPPPPPPAPDPEPEYIGED